MPEGLLAEVQAEAKVFGIPGLEEVMEKSAIKPDQSLTYDQVL